MEESDLASSLEKLSLKTDRDMEPVNDAISKSNEDAKFRSDNDSPYINERRGNKPLVRISRQGKLPIGVDFGQSRIISTFNKNSYLSLKVHKKDKSSGTKIEVPVDSQTNRVSFTHSKQDTMKWYADVANAKDDMLKLLTTNESLNSDGIDKANRTVKGLNVELLPHQVHGLKFLKAREDKSESFTGGLLCDDMGLGKTIQMLALILERKKKNENEEKTNLIVCPVSLINQWKDEITSKAPELKTHIYHGSNRTRDHKELLKYDVVITSYSTVSSEYHSHIKSPLFKFVWWRIILDEAHQIKSSKTKLAKACFELESFRRWCVTGTPIQNHIDELHSLLMFINVSKFSKHSEWRALFSKKVTSHADIVYSLKDLKDELSSLMLRRTKEILKSSSEFNLPPKAIHKFEIDFSSFERGLYDEISDTIRIRILSRFYYKGTSDTTSKDSNSKVKVRNSALPTGNYNNLSALLFLLRLRQLCCNWKLVFETEKSSKTENHKIENEIDDISLQLSNMSVNERFCNICQEKLLHKLDNVICGSCEESYSDSLKFDELPSKFKALLKILSEDEDRETVVFSQFTTILRQLDLVLKKNNYKTFLYTGQSTIKKREDTLKKAKETRGAVLLCSLRCSSVGLNLTFANRVIIMDPYWNPAIQDQAIDRVFRIGQNKPVDVYEIIVNNTVEDKIVKMQERKRILAEQVITGNKSKAKESTKKLSQKELFELLDINGDGRSNGLSLREVAR